MDGNTHETIEEDRSRSSDLKRKETQNPQVIIITHMLLTKYKKIITGLSGVAHVIPSHLYKIQTTRSWDYLQLSSHYPTEFVQKSKLGDGVIIGLLDTGSLSFSHTCMYTLLYINIVRVPLDKQGYGQNPKFSATKDWGKSLLAGRGSVSQESSSMAKNTATEN